MKVDTKRVSTFFLCYTINMEGVLMREGREYRYWNKEDKLKMVKEVFEGNSVMSIARKYDVSDSLIHSWMNRYAKYGEKALENKKKPGNPLMKYSRRKHLSEIEKLEYENMKLRIENERLKKGYMVKGDGQFVVFNMPKDKNSK